MNWEQCEKGYPWASYRRYKFLIFFDNAQAIAHKPLSHWEKTFVRLIWVIWVTIVFNGPKVAALLVNSVFMNFRVLFVEKIINYHLTDRLWLIGKLFGFEIRAFLLLRLVILAENLRWKIVCWFLILDLVFWQTILEYLRVLNLTSVRLIDLIRVLSSIKIGSIVDTHVNIIRTVF